MITLAKLNLGLLYFDKGYGTNGPEVGLDLIQVTSGRNGVLPCSTITGKGCQKT